jgi:flavorubredoxin
VSETDQQASGRAYFTRPGPPREVATGVYWLGGCSDTGAGGGYGAGRQDRRHVYTNAYLVIGSERSLMVETGHTSHWDGIVADLEAVLGDRALDYVFPTHQEIPHCGNLPRLAERYPELVVVGDVRDYPLYYPSLDLEMLHPTEPGSTIDLGGVTVEFLHAVWHDLPGTQWLMAHGPDVLFCVDGLQYSHEHWVEDCGKISSELSGLPAAGLIEAPARDTIKWAVYSDMVTLGQQFIDLMDERRPRLFAPSHGAPIAAESIDLIGAILTTIDTMSRASKI